MEEGGTNLVDFFDKLNERNLITVVDEVEA